MTAQEFHDSVIAALNANGYTLEPINNNQYSIKDEPHWKIVRL